VRHEPILAALEARDPVAAEQAARWHIEELREWILEAEVEAADLNRRQGAVSAPS
jgi:DNA-binding GntR family transcriptional regulator